jgi:hypothetical protein
VVQVFEVVVIIVFGVLVIQGGVIKGEEPIMENLEEQMVYLLMVQDYNNYFNYFCCAFKGNY